MMLEIIICALVVAAHWVLYWYLKREHHRAQGQFLSWHERQLLRALHPELILRSFSQAAELPPASGKTIKWRRYCLKSE